MTLSMYQWRAYIGPAYAPSTDADHYSWPDLWIYSIAPYTQQTTLAATLASGATTATLVAGSQILSSGGGVWIGPNGAGEGFEYCGYSGISSNTMSGLIREPTAVRAHNGVHTIGATVTQWYLVTGDSGQIRLTEQLDQTMSAITWGAQISGILAPVPAMRANHLIIIQTRANLGTWTNTLIGFCRQPRIRDTYERLREWSLDIVCAAQVIDSYRSKSIRVGAFNFAAAGSASTDTCLIEALKERMSGDFISSAPTLTGQSAIDDDMETLWIAERLRGTVRSVTLTTDPGSSLVHGGFCTGARLWRFPGEPRGHRYLEFVAPAVGGLRIWPNAHICSKDHANAVIVPFGGVSTAAGDLLIIAENADTFEAANPLSEAIGVYEIGSAFFDGLDLAGDAIALRIMQPGGGNFYPTVAWGTGGTPERLNDGSHEYGGTWDTDTITAPTIGQLIRYNYVAGSPPKKDYFLTDLIDAPGYRSGGEDPWIQIALPLIGLASRDDITDSAPGTGAELYITKGGSDGTEGLTATGTIQIGLEQITYSARSSVSVTVTARGANATTAAAHAAGDIVRVVDLDGIATQGQLIDKIGWKRPDGFPYPQAFKIRTSNLDGARVPSDDNHEDDYHATLIEEHTWADHEYSVTLSPARRCTFVIVEIDHMNVDPYRPRLNEIEVYGDDAQFDANLIMAPVYAEAIIARVISNTGFTAFALDMTAGATTLDGLVTAEDASAWTVASSLAAQTGVLLDCARAGAVAIKPNTLPAGTLTAATTWTDVNASACEFVQTGSAVIGQIKIPYRLPDDTTGEAKYPAEPTPEAGQVIKYGEARYATYAAALAAATRAYTIAKYPLTMLVECAEEQPTIRPGAVARVQWTFDDASPQMDRLVIVTGADHEINAGIWTTVLTCQQVDREWPA